MSAKRGKPRCFVTVLDGTPVRVHGNPKMSKKSRDALEEIVRAAKQMIPPTPKPKRGKR